VGRAVRAATDRPADAGPRAIPRAAMSRERLIGTIVHRLMQRGLDPGMGADGLAPLVPRLLRSTEMVDVDDLDALTGDAVALYTRLRGQEDLARTLAAGECLYEVPFSFEPADRPGELVRGVIDCVVRKPDGRATVIEFKTGKRRDEHAAQADLYAGALRTVLAATEVDVRIWYAEDSMPTVPAE
jgi:ATP-dependent exoDNAse (exonuclease V) beta subunit